MMEILKKVIDFAIKYFTKKKFLYKWAGRFVLLSILTELGSFALPEELRPDYLMIKEVYGWFSSAVLSFFVGKYAGGYDWGSIGVKMLIFLSCLFVEIKINASQGGGKSVVNYFFGLFQKIDQNYD